MPKPTWDQQKERWQVIVPPQNGEPRKRRYFKSKADALDYASSLKGLRDSSLTDFMRLAPDVRGRLLRCLETAGGIDDLESVARSAAARRVAMEKPLRDAVPACVESKEKAGRSWQYVENLGVALGQFISGRESQTVSSVIGAHVSDWLHSGQWSTETRRTYLRRLETFFSFAIKQGWCVSNPCDSVERMKPGDSGICILSVQDCRRLLEACRRVDLDLLPYFAIGLFAGIRPDEVKRLKPEHIKGDWIHVDQRKGRTRRRRLVEIHPTLRAWLDLGGEIGWKNWRRRWRSVRNGTAVTEYGPAVPVQWGADILRHTFCSYAYPIKGAHWTSMHAGHSEQVLFSRYRELVTEEQAREFWGIVPG